MEVWTPAESEAGSVAASWRLPEAGGQLRGRDGALVSVGKHLDRLMAGLGTVVVFEGGAGMGKTRLLEEVARMATQLSIRVGSGFSEPSDAVVQLAPIMGALFDGARPILEREDLGDAHSSPEQRYWLLQDIEALLERAAMESPVLILLDDLQWADSATATALRALPRRLASVPVGWVLALRPNSGTAQLADSLSFLEVNGAERIVLGPLDHAAVAQVASDVLQAEPQDALLKLTDRAEGNPFLLVELLSGLRDEQLVRLESGRAELVGTELPQRVSDSMRARLLRLSETSRQLATVAASLGRRFTLNNAAEMLAVPPSALVMPVEELIHSNVLVEREGRLGFPHDLTLEAVRSSVSLPVRRALDRQAAFVLLAAGALPVEVAMQLAASAESGDEAAVSTLLKAAEMLGPTDPGAAADLSQRALDLCPPKHLLRGPLAAGTTVWLHAAGRGLEAKAFADTALRQSLPSEQEAAVRLSIASMFSISPDVRADACREALVLPNVEPKVRARLSALLFHNLVTAGRTDEARAALEESARAVREREDPGGQFVLELAQSGLAYGEDDFDGSLRFVDVGLRTSVNTDDETRAHLTRQWRCDTLMMLDRFDEALEYGTGHIVAAQRDRQAWALHTYETGRARLFLEMGKLADAAAVLEENYSVDTAHEVVSVMDAAGVVALGRVAIHRGDQPLMRQAGEIALIMGAHGAPSVRRHGVWLLALLAMAAGRADRAHDWLCRHGDQERLKIVPRFPMGATDEVTLVHMAQRAEDPELAFAACEWSKHRELANPGVRSIAAVAAHTGGLVRRNPTQLAQAVELFEGGPRPLALASACEDFGIICVEDAETEQGIAAFTRALSLYATSGAAWDAARLRGRLRVLGVRRRLSVPQRPRSGWAALTDSELEVARLVAHGFTNREVAERLFVSHYTVSGHLRSIYNKLDINSRVELSRLVNENLKR